MNKKVNINYGLMVRRLNEEGMSSEGVVSLLQTIYRFLFKEGDSMVSLVKEELIPVMLARFREFWDVENEEGYSVSTGSANVRLHVLYILNELCNYDKFHEELFGNNTFDLVLDCVEKLPPCEERKLLLRVFSLLSEDVFLRERVKDLLNTKYPEGLSENTGIWAKLKISSYHNVEEEYFLDGLRCLDIVLDKYQPGGMPFYNTQEFEICRVLEANYEIIKEEMVNIRNTDLSKWPEEYLCKEGWEVLEMFAFENKIQRGHNICPKTAEILASIPGVTTALYSCLRPRTHIKPHIGYYHYSEKILRCHLGLTVPTGCTLKCNGIETEIKEGECILFDDTFRHEAWNPSYDTTRIVLMVDVLTVVDLSNRSKEFLEKSSKIENVDDALVSRNLMQALESQGIEGSSNYTDRNQYQYPI